MPENADRVDPKFNFVTDEVTPNRDAYSHDVYAHELYPKPNYNGLLVSKMAIEGNQQLKTRLESTGIHKHLRVPRKFPILGDCGAFNYIDQEVPPFETEETVLFYQNLDFDLGVSIDHLIVPGLLKKKIYAVVNTDGNEKPIAADLVPQYEEEGYAVQKRPRSRDMFAEDKLIYTWEEENLDEAKRRWKLTLDNAKDFMETHKRLKAEFTPIAGCQGWDTESQAEMFKAQQDMGYDYIALGGLVRSSTEEIINVLEEVNKVRKPSTKIHLFGVSRPSNTLQFKKQRVDSTDSTSPLKQGLNGVYYGGSPESYAKMATGGSVNLTIKNYTAIRIRLVVRQGTDKPTEFAKNAVNNGESLENLIKKEKNVLDLVHSYDRKQSSLDDTLKAIMEYGILMGDKPSNESKYRKTLTDRPWEKCPCTVCKQTGIDVLIFRRNNRNRRRGFHNTWWFHQVFKKLTT